jgi:serine/threonine-protein kinase
VGVGGGYLYAVEGVFATEPVGPVDFITVPGLLGLSVDAAARRLEQAGLGVGEVDSIRHPRAVAGGIVGQAPFEGQLALRGAPVDLAVSLGPEVRPIPDVTRLRGDRAFTVLETSGFQVVVDSVQSPVTAGQVIATDPAPGTRLSLPARVRMLVSLGPPLVVVPNLVGLTEDQARARLLEVGLAVGEIEIESRFGFGQGDVLRTFPQADAMIPQGSPVRLVIRRRALLPGGTFP